MLGGVARADDAADPQVTVAAAGDVLFGRYLTEKNYSQVPREEDPFEDVSPFFKAADLAFVNIESPVTVQPKRFSVYHAMTFRAAPEKMKVVADAGIKEVSLANNHMFNMGAAAIPDSVKNCEDAGLRPLGAGATLAQALKPALIQIGNVRVAFLAYTLWSNSGSGVQKEGAIAFFQPEDKLIKAAAPMIHTMRRWMGADFVIVSIHWGTEYKEHPNGGQKQVAHALVDAGADLILGHHPHVVEDVEKYHGALIAYSMGNFIFDQFKLDQRQSIIVRATLAKSAELFTYLKEEELVPVLIDTDRTPRLVKGRAYKTWATRLGKMAKGIPIRPEPGDDEKAVEQVKPLDNR
jgi:poly-gamma-glutamate synthesis protein (capsule biosynthesis protein)